MKIREAHKSDFEEIFNVINSSFSTQSESDLVKQLILDDDVLINLVAESSGKIIGNVIVSKTTMEHDEGLFCGGVAPVSVLPKHQLIGIGSKLMREVIKKSKMMSIDALFLVGDPNYYRRFGFTISKLKNDFSVKNFQELELTENCLVNVNSKISYANAFVNL
jgi:putative acetyltransferase